MKPIGAETAKLAGLQIDLLQKLRSGNLSLDHLECFLNLKKEARNELLSKTKNEFLILYNAVVQISDDYEHQTQLLGFKEKYQKLFHNLSDKITDAKYANIVNHLEAGKKYNIRIFYPTRDYTIHEALEFLNKQPNNILIGPQGLSAMFPFIKDIFPAEVNLVSLAEPESFYQIQNGIYEMPMLSHVLNTWHWIIEYISGENSELANDYYLLSVCEL